MDVKMKMTSLAPIHALAGALFASLLLAPPTQAHQDDWVITLGYASAPSFSDNSDQRG